ncbi:MAG: di-heme oxidoredictase family protein [Planctomycetota bacterium]
MSSTPILQFRHLVLGTAALAVFSMQGQGTSGEETQLERGRALFDKAFSIPEGLGSPDINGDSCRACHQDPVLGGAGPIEVNVTRFARDNGGAGPFENLAGGQILSKLRVPTTHGREEYETTGLAAADVFEQRQTPSILGDGLIDQIPGAVITSNEDVNDADNDGIFGVARRLEIGGVIEIGRFGWKAQVPRLSDFVDDAMGGELGLTSPDNGRGFALLSDGDAVADPEVSQAVVEDVAFFIEQLPAPERAGSSDPRVADGLSAFAEVGCAKCHTPSLPSPMGPVPLYSNLLLHNVMPADFRGMEEPGAGVGFFRTPPLWGIRDTAPYMHDGRAEDLRGAILAHFGEADQVRMAFETLSPERQEALLLFLEDL